MRIRFFREGLFQLAVGVGVASVIAIFALVSKNWTWPNAFVGGVLLLCGLLYLMEKLGIGPSTKSRVREWPDSSGFNIQTVRDANEFHFRTTDAVGITTDILQAKFDSPVIIASAHHRATPQQVAGFNALTPERRADFWRMVRLELLKYGVQFSNLVLEGDGVTFTESVMVDSAVTGPEFLQRLSFVRSGARLYLEFLLELYDASESSVATAPFSGQSL
jgi:hypothetical protein